MNFDYDTTTEVILHQQNLIKAIYPEPYNDELYTIDCQRSLEVVMIEITSPTIQKDTPFTCLVYDLSLVESVMCNTEQTNNPGKIYLRRTRGRFFSFAFEKFIDGNLSFKAYISSIEAHNGEPCFESIKIDDNQINVSSAHPRQILSDTKYIFTGWIHDITDQTPWILVDLIAVTTIEGVGIYFSKDCDIWTTFSLHYGTNKEQLHLYKHMEFKILPPEYVLEEEQSFVFPSPIKARYVKFNDSHETPADKPRCLFFQMFGCKLTRK
ncbi:uncharacterized protein LOC132713745 [Ruditapes philippinarum]|uniref:uncharacterized protein LOC132713745 n=1 Tax=Ruditapes philippinarum TaxID=129788 RepID=UPI00295AC819|nr:uncharacterized protein LOC132713745 [Ruditapes philippinarum]